MNGFLLSTEYWAIVPAIANIETTIRMVINRYISGSENCLRTVLAKRDVSVQVLVQNTVDEGKWCRYDAIYIRVAEH